MGCSPRRHPQPRLSFPWWADSAGSCSFCPQYQKSVDTWVFVAPRDDAQTPSGYSTVQATEPAIKQAWTHLVGTYDASTRTLALYVDGKRMGTKTGAVTWQASKALQIGRGKASGLLGNFFRGAINDRMINTGSVVCVLRRWVVVVEVV